MIWVWRLKGKASNKEKEKNKMPWKKNLAVCFEQTKAYKWIPRYFNILDALKEQFEKVFKEYSDEMRLKLTTEATSIFKELIDRKDKNLINRININEKYEIDIIGWDQINITQDISQGQRQVVALSFITALAKVASGGSEDINFPLFMDTPFGRISGNNRDHLIDHIPKT